MKSSEKSPTYAVVIVTHNSQLYLEKCLLCLQQQSLKPTQIIIVDSGSTDNAYVRCYQKRKNMTVILNPVNIGFCRGNNLGYRQIQRSCDYVLFLNPDAFLTPHFVKGSIAYLQQPGHRQIGAITGMLLGYDREKDQPTGKYDSTGIFRCWYGRWQDRGQGESYPNVLYQEEESIPAICGAVMLCRKEALDRVLLNGKEVMDPAFYMYKEDIDLSLRLRKDGWDLRYVPSLIAYHCRGWDKDRKKVPKDLRLMSARNEMRLYSRHCSPCFLYSALKYAAVKLFNC